MKYEIRRTKNGALLRVERDDPEGETEEICYRETNDGAKPSLNSPARMCAPSAIRLVAA